MSFPPNTTGFVHASQAPGRGFNAVFPVNRPPPGLGRGADPATIPCFNCRMYGHTPGQCRFPGFNTQETSHAPSSSSGLFKVPKAPSTTPTVLNSSAGSQASTNQAKMNEPSPLKQIRDAGRPGSAHSGALPQSMQTPDKATKSNVLDLRSDITRLRDCNVGIKLHLGNIEDILARQASQLDNITTLLELHEQRIKVIEGGNVEEDISNDPTNVEIPPPLTFDGMTPDVSLALWIAAMKIYLEAAEAVKDGLTDHKKVMLIATSLRGPALQYWIRCTSGHKVTGCDQCLDLNSTCPDGAVEDGTACTPCKIRDGDNANCSYKQSLTTSNLPKNASEAFKVLEKQYGVVEKDLQTRWDSLQQTSSVQQLDSTCQRLFETMIPQPRRGELKNKFYNALKPEIRGAMIKYVTFSKHVMDHQMSYQDIVKKALAAERILNDQGKGPVEDHVQRQPVSISRTVSNQTNRTSAHKSDRPIPPTRIHNPQLKNFGFGARMPKKGSAEWTNYCRARGACFECGQLTHSSSQCRQIPLGNTQTIPLPPSNTTSPPGPTFVAATPFGLLAPATRRTSADTGPSSQPQMTKQAAAGARQTYSSAVQRGLAGTGTGTGAGAGKEPAKTGQQTNDQATAETKTAEEEESLIDLGDD